MTFLTSPGKTYSIYSAAGCTVSVDGTVVVTVDPGKQIAFVAPDEEIVVSDAAAIIVEVTGIGADLTVAEAGSVGGGVTAEAIKAVVPIDWDETSVAFAANTDPQTNTAPNWRKTQLYFSGANTPLANEYYNGEAFMGYTVTDKDNTVLACGTRRLSELFTDNTLTQPASIDENGEWVQPKVFHPSDLDLPREEEPTEEPEDVTVNIPETVLPEPEPYTPLPVYTIVEPEDITTNLPEPEPYTPLPVYPIVEPEIEEIPSES